MKPYNINSSLSNFKRIGKSESGPSHTHLDVLIDKEEEYPLMCSFWEISEEELKQINDTKTISLKIFGNNHPIVSISAIDRKYIDTGNTACESLFLIPRTDI